MQPSVFKLSSAFLLLLVAVEAVVADVATSNPTVNLSYGTFEGTPSGRLDAFLGIPFAAPPIGDLRFAHPKPPTAFQGVRQVTSFGAACPQEALSASALPPIVFSTLPGPLPNISEDCLFINVVRPANVKEGTKLPVIYYIFGGGFEAGDSSSLPGNALVNRSIDLQAPIIQVSSNYRLNAFGFLGGKEVMDAGIGNAGLQDQRFALQWIQEHISAFGGDPTKVTIWGESAGAVSVGLHMVLGDGQTGGLFRGAFMQSGSPIMIPHILDDQPQRHFDQLVSDTNCTTAADKLACLRSISTAQLLDAVDLQPDFLSFPSVNLTWQPMVDGNVIVRDPLTSLQQGKYAKVPFVTGDCEDEGTILSFGSLNITTNDEFLQYVKTEFLPHISDADLSALALAYPDDVTKGSPFNSGTANALTPEFKRIAAFQGDYFFQAPRRFLLKIASATQAAYAFRYIRGASTAEVGAYHTSDIPEFQGTGPDFIGADTVIYFTNTGNPNAPRGSPSLLANVTWNKWSSSPASPPLFTFLDPAPGLNFTSDTYRESQMELLNRLSLNEVAHGF